jgi:hypothetical protein
MYFDLSIGKTFSANAAQCGQLIEAVFSDGHRRFCWSERHVGQRHGLGHEGCRRTLRHGFADQMHGRESDESGKPCERQGAGEGAANNGQLIAPKSAVVRANIGRSLA